MAMKIGRPVAFFVSDPKLWPTMVEKIQSDLPAPRQVDLLTPCNGQADSGVCPACDAKSGKVADFISMSYVN